MTNQTCSTCAYFLKSDRGFVCNAFHTPQEGAIECADWEAKKTENLDQGQIPVAEIQRRRAEEEREVHDAIALFAMLRRSIPQQAFSGEPTRLSCCRWLMAIPSRQIEAMSIAIERQLHNLPPHLLEAWNNDLVPPGWFRLASQFISIPHSSYWEDDRLLEASGLSDPRANPRIDRRYEIQSSIEARSAAISRDMQRRADENESIRTYYRIDPDSSPIVVRRETTTFENGRAVSRDAETNALSPNTEPRSQQQSISFSNLQHVVLNAHNHSQPSREGEILHCLSGRVRLVDGHVPTIDLIAIATPNGLRWQYSGNIIID